MADCKYSTVPFNVSTIQSNNKQERLLQKFAYVAFLGLILCLSWNLMSIAAVWFQGKVATQSLFLAIAYLVVGVPAAYASWYRTLNIAIQEKNPSMFKWFLVFYSFHLVLLELFSRNPLKGRYPTGILSVVDVCCDHSFVLVLFFIGCALVGAELGLSIMSLMLSAFMYYHRGGVSLTGDDLASMEP